ncbi:MAG: GNAT family N-acetyltransferase [Saprospiraceae bacterium]
MFNDEIKIRDAVSEDIHSMTDLLNQLGYKTNLQEMTTRFDKIYIHPEYKTLVAESTDGLEGMIGMARSISYELNEPMVRILVLVVDQNSRKKGIASLLVSHAEEWAKESGAPALLLNCGNREERKAAHLFYPKIGFELKSSGYRKNIS